MDGVNVLQLNPVITEKQHKSTLATRLVGHRKGRKRYACPCKLHELVPYQTNEVIESSDSHLIEDLEPGAQMLHVTWYEITDEGYLDLSDSFCDTIPDACRSCLFWISCYLHYAIYDDETIMDMTDDVNQDIEASRCRHEAHSHLFRNATSPV